MNKAYYFVLPKHIYVKEIIPNTYLFQLYALVKSFQVESLVILFVNLY